MDYGAHLPLMALDGRPWTLDRLLEYAQTAESEGFQALAANDHLVFGRPWLDGPTALAAVLSRTGRMALATTVALPVVRGPVALAKSVAAIDLLSGGRLVVGVGPGSSASDYAAVRVPFEERWKRLEEAVRALRTLWSGEGPPFRGSFYSTEGLTLEPYPAQRPGPPSGSAAGVRKSASGGWRAWATVGWLPPTTPPRKRSQPLGEGSQKILARRKDPEPVPQRHRDDVLLRHRRPRHIGADPPVGTWPDAQPPAGRATSTSAGRPRRGVRGEACVIPSSGSPADLLVAGGRRGAPASDLPGASRTAGR